LPKKGKFTETSKELMRPGEGEVICVVKKMLGGEHVVVACLDGKERVGRIPGRLKKRVWIGEGDVVLVAPWDFQSNKCDILHKYGNDEIKRLEEENLVKREVLDELRG
jgi:translation initiation factor 1A